MALANVDDFWNANLVVEDAPASPSFPSPPPQEWLM